MTIPPHHDPTCWGCGDNAHGIHLPLPTNEGTTTYEATFRFDQRHQGGPGIVHGGLVAAALDEACSLLATWHSFPTVTARISVRFRRPVPINADLRARARVTSDRGRHIEIRSELVRADELLAEADGSFLHVPLDHFLQTPDGREAGETWRRRLCNP